MKTEHKNRKCRDIKSRLYSLLSRHIGPQANWIQQHIAACPRCQSRLLATSKVSVALQLLKSHSHSLDLLMRANSMTVSVLNHSLRNSTKAQKLKKALPEPSLLEKLRKYRSVATNIAACITILVLMKAGLFSSTEKFQKDSQKALMHYYTTHVGDDITNEVFHV